MSVIMVLMLFEKLLLPLLVWDEGQPAADQWLAARLSWHSLQETWSQVLLEEEEEEEGEEEGLQSIDGETLMSCDHRIPHPLSSLMIIKYRSTLYIGMAMVYRVHGHTFGPSLFQFQYEMDLS